MKPLTLCLLPAVSVFSSPVCAALFSWSGGFAGGGAVPDGNPAGWSDTRVVAAAGPGPLSDVNVRLQISGGWNGDLYVYLQHGSGLSILLNRPGRRAGDPFGFSGSGMNVVFDDTGAYGDSHLTLDGPDVTAGVLWEPDARLTSPLEVTEGGARTAWLSGFRGMDPAGDWTLFVADLSGGAVSTVTGWGLELTGGADGAAVPETGTVAGLVLLLGAVLTLRRRF